MKRLKQDPNWSKLHRDQLLLLFDVYTRVLTLGGSGAKIDVYV